MNPALQMICAVLGFVTALEVIPERPDVQYVNPKYAKWGNFTVVRYGRRSPYYINIEGHSILPLGNNVTFEAAFYEFLSNMYKPTIVQIRMKFCKFLTTESYVGNMILQKLGNFTCPIQPGEYHMMNMTLFMLDRLPFKFPITWTSSVVKGRVDGRLYVPDTNETIASGRLYITLKDK